MSGMLGREELEDRGSFAPAPVPEPDPDEKVEEPTWFIAQEEPGLVNHVWWSIIDTRNHFVRGRFYGRANAQLVVDLLADHEVKGDGGTIALDRFAELLEKWTHDLALTDDQHSLINSVITQVRQEIA